MTPRVRALIAATLAAVALAVLLLPRDGAARSDRWTALTDSPLARTEVAAARLGRFIYVVGGFVAPGDGTSAAVERYDIRRDRWTRVADMPIAVNHPAAVAYRGRVYVHGGYASGLSQPTSALLRYNPERDRWKRTARRTHAARGPRAGGHRRTPLRGRRALTTSGSLRSLEIYSLRRNRWSAGPSFPGPARNHTTGVAIGRALLRAGRARRRQPHGGRALRPAPARLAAAAAASHRRAAASPRCG